MEKSIVLAALVLFQGVAVNAALKINSASDKCKAQWFEEFVPMADGVKLLEKGDRLRVDVSGASRSFAPHPNVAGDAFRVNVPRVAHNQVFAGESGLILFVHQ